jgi:2-hydroxycyclohexanecarboxyl-CoA dehydrogenase
MSEQVALVTGGARGIGRAIAVALARDGRAVAVGDLLADQAAQVADEIHGAGGRALALALDVTDADAVAACVRRAAGELGPIDVLVNCAGWDELKPFLASDEAFWRRVIAVNYEGALRTTHAVLGGMLERRFGRIVNVSSDAARVGSAHEAVYAGAKAAVIAFTKTIARESAKRGVTANVVCPGPPTRRCWRAWPKRGRAATSWSARSHVRCQCAALADPRTSPPRSPSWRAKTPATSPGRRCRSAVALRWRDE